MLWRVSAMLASRHKRERWATNFCNSSLAALPRVSRSSLVLLGLIDLTSSGPTCRSTGPTADESRGTIIVPLLLRLGRRGRIGVGAWMGWSTDVPEEESDQSIFDPLEGPLSSIRD